MLLLQNKIGQIGESVREFRTTLSNLSGIEPSRICKNEYDDFEISVKIKSQKMRFIFDGIQVGAADELYGFGGHIEIFKPNGSILLWRLGMNTFIPKLQFDDLVFSDQSFFAIDDKTNDLKLFHTLDFFECTSSNDLIGTWGHGQVKKKLDPNSKPPFHAAG